MFFDNKPRFETISLKHVLQTYKFFICITYGRIQQNEINCIHPHPSIPTYDGNMLV